MMIHFIIIFDRVPICRSYHAFVAATGIYAKLFPFTILYCADKRWMALGYAYEEAKVCNKRSLL